MTRRALLAIALAGITAIVGVAAAQPGSAISPTAWSGDPRQAMAEAMRREQAARQRAETLSAEARQLGDAAARNAREAAALAAQIQQAEAAIAAQTARRALIAQRRAALNARLEAKRAPLARLVAALQMLARRPPALALVRAEALEDAVHLRAVLAGMQPVIAQRTAELRGELAAVRSLEREGEAAVAALSAARATLDERRGALAQAAARQRMASAEIRSEASREEDRALALAEDSRDLGDLTVALERSAALRAELAALPGPRLRDGGEPTPTRARASLAATPRFILPADGRLVSGFGSGRKGVTLATTAGAQIVAPAAGRVAFAGPYEGYGVIVIIEHGGGWISLVTGLRQSDAAVGARVIQGSPIGPAGTTVGYELRQGGAARDPLALAAP